jgi:dihydroorotate dehydrogenase (fumarate)
MGLELRSPLVPSGSPLSKNIDLIKRLEDNGAAAVVLASLFEEQLTGNEVILDHFLERDAHSHGEAASYFPELTGYNNGPNGYLEHIAATKKAVDIPVIASLNATTDGGWINYASSIQEAGADGLELNMYFLPTDLELSGTRIESLYLDVLSEVKRVVQIPVAMKLSPFFSSIPNMAKQLSDAGADALVLFNRFYQPDINIEELTVDPSINLSTSLSSRLPMRWIAILYKRIQASLAATSGVHSHVDVLKLLMAGADVTMMAAALIKQGPSHLRNVESGLRQWMEEHEYESVEQMKGSMSHRSCPDPSGFERANYVKALNSVEVTIL